MYLSDMPIGVMDSGVGGVSVLRALRLLMPRESYVYYGDSANAPYGTKAPEMIRELVFRNAEILLNYGCKALVIACNTATAVAVDHLRRRYPFFPIVGLEPAIRPALAHAKAFGGNVLVLATGVTLAEERFKLLCASCCAELGGEVITADEYRDNAVIRRKTRGDTPSVCLLDTQEIVGYVENGMEKSEELTEYLKGRLSVFRDIEFESIALGCTHFPFASESIAAALGYRPNFFDGGFGAAKRLRELLEENGNLVTEEYSGASASVVWLTSVTQKEKAYSELLRRLCHLPH